MVLEVGPSIGSSAILTTEHNMWNLKDINQNGTMCNTVCNTVYNAVCNTVCHKAVFYTTVYNIHVHVGSNTVMLYDQVNEDLNNLTD